MMARRRNAIVALAGAGIVAGMVGLSFAAVPLYQLFCQVTGFGGTTQRAQQGATAAVGAREVTVTFDANVNGGLPWTFEPAEREVRVKLGEQWVVHYRAVNNAKTPVTGVATFNVTPFKAGPYFSKIECFCFTEQTLAPGESVEMPVMFYVDPALLRDRAMDDVSHIVLSYTFFRAEPAKPPALEAAAAVAN